MNQWDKIIVLNLRLAISHTLVRISGLQIRPGGKDK